ATAAADYASAVSGADTAADLIAAVDANPASDFRVQQDARQSAALAAGIEAAEINIQAEIEATIHRPAAIPALPQVPLFTGRTPAGGVPHNGLTPAPTIDGFTVSGS